MASAESSKASCIALENRKPGRRTDEAGFLEATIVALRILRSLGTLRTLNSMI